MLQDSVGLQENTASDFSKKENRTPLILTAILAAVCFIVVLWCAAIAEASNDETGGYLLTSATISDSTSPSESTSEIDTSAALLEALSFVEGNPYFLNPRDMFTSSYQFPLHTDSWVEKCSWTYDDNGRVKTADFYKSTNSLSSITYSYDSHGSISKMVGYSNIADSSGDVNQEDFEASFVNEALSSSAYGVNKITVVLASGTANDTILFIYDKDKNITEISSTGTNEYKFEYTYNTTYKFVTEVKISVDGDDEGILLVPSYDGTNKLVSLQTGTWSGDTTELDNNEYEILYSGSKYSKVNYYEDGEQVRYYEFKYDEDNNLSSLREYRKGGLQLYNISFSYEAV